MKTTLLLSSSLLLAVPAFAGTSQVMTESSPPPQQENLWSWFVGASGGYLFDFEEDMYTLQIGAKSPWSVSGWSVSLFGEVGWTQNHDDVDLPSEFRGNASSDVDIIPVTFNVKFEHPISGALTGYFGGGVGASYVDADIDFFEFHDSGNDWVFTGQVFAGLAYHFNETSEIFVGARWIYFDDPDLDGISLGDDVMVEGGLRFHF